MLDPDRLDGPADATRNTGRHDNASLPDDAGSGLKFFTTCPLSSGLPQGGYLDVVQDVARWSEDAGCEGILVFTDNGQLDPWLVSQIIIASTRRLCPLVAVQPAYMHPYTVAKMVASIGNLYGRKLYLNMVAGGFKNDLAALNDTTPHDERYHRLVEYTTVIQRLLDGPGAVTFEGRYYKVSNLKMTPPLPGALAPGILLSGSSAAGAEAATRLGATPVEYPKPPAACAGDAAAGGHARGMRIGIIARPRDGEAWDVARERFPEDRKGQVTHRLAMQVSDSVWHRHLSALGRSQDPSSPYWLVPFENYKATCPYLVGSYDRVADELAHYVRTGYRTFILDAPANADELRHVGATFEQAQARSVRGEQPC